jgi:tRNA (cytidine/uridine-2'-O-)-methyltransferase
MSAPRAGLHLVLITPEIPANTGNIVRLCAATGVWLHLIEPLGFRLDDRLLRRAGLDYWRDCRLATHLTYAEFERAHPEAPAFFLSARAEASLFDQTIPRGAALVLGPESTGLSQAFLAEPRPAGRAVRIPMPGRGRSLNLSTTAGIVVYEALRQGGLLAAPPGR